MAQPVDPCESFEQYRQGHGYTSYCHLTWWCWLWLGKNIRVEQPSSFLKTSESYTGIYPTKGLVQDFHRGKGGGGGGGAKMKEGL